MDLRQLQAELEGVLGSALSALHMINTGGLRSEVMTWIKVGKPHTPYLKATELFLGTTAEGDFSQGAVYRSLINEVPENGFYEYANLYFVEPWGHPEIDEPRGEVVRRTIPWVGPRSATTLDASGETTKDLWEFWVRSLSGYYGPDHWTMWVGMKLGRRDEVEDIPFALFAVGSGAITNECQYKLARLMLRAGVRHLTDLHEEAVLRVAMRAGVSRVMARCMSHNLGSHVLTSLTQPEHFLKIALEHTDDRESEEWKNRDFHEVKREADGSFKLSGDRRFLLNSKPGSIDQQLAAFNRYLRTRMDFLADVATGVAPFASGMRLYEDLLTPFVETKLVQKSITGIESKTLSPSISIAEGNGSAIVAVPNDQQGAHAMFVILENMVRNSAKYGDPMVKEVELEVAINEELSTSELLAIELYDCKDVKDAGLLGDLVEAQNVRLRASMIDNNGQMRPGSWGMLEMKIAACYLRGLDTALLDEALQHPLLTTIPKEVNGKSHLAYRLYLHRYREALFILQDGEYAKLKVLLENEKSQGWQTDSHIIHSEHGYSLTSEAGLDLIDGSISHAIVIVDERITDVPAKRLPWRCVRMGMDHITTGKPSALLSVLEDLTARAMEKHTHEAVLGMNHRLVVDYLDDSEGEALGGCEIGSGSEVLKATYVRHPNRFHQDWFEAFPSAHPLSKDCNPLLGWYNEPPICRARAAMHFAEARMLPIAIVDERIQRESIALREPSIQNGANRMVDMLRAAGIQLPYRKTEEISAKGIVPSHRAAEVPSEVNLQTGQVEINLDGADTERIKHDLDFWIDERLAEPGFVVVHMGVLERVQGWKEVPDLDKIKKLEEWLQVRMGPDVLQCPGRIVFTSGRSRPEFLSAEMPFISYSLLARYTLEQRSKFHLTKLLIASHAPRNQRAQD